MKLKIKIKKKNLSSKQSEGRKGPKSVLNEGQRAKEAEKAFI